MNPKIRAAGGFELSFCVGTFDATPFSVVTALRRVVGVVSALTTALRREELVGICVLLSPALRREELVGICVLLIGASVLFL